MPDWGLVISLRQYFRNKAEKYGVTADCEAWPGWAMVLIIGGMVYETLCIFKNDSLICSISKLVGNLEQLQYQSAQYREEGNGLADASTPSVWCEDTTESDCDTADEDEPSDVVVSQLPSTVQGSEEHRENGRLIIQVNGVHSHQADVEGEATPTEETNGNDPSDATEFMLPTERTDSWDSDSAVGTTSLPPSARDSPIVGTEV